MELINKLKDSVVDELVWREELKEPFTGEHRFRTEPNTFCHYHNSYFVSSNAMPRKVNQTQNTELIIEDVMFLYTDNGLDRFDESYWMCIGKTNNKNNNGLHYYFMYDSGCCGTGFGLGSTSKLYLADSLEDIVDYGLTNEQRRLVW